MNRDTLALDRLFRVTNTASLLALGLVLWILNHPYQGVWHDANIYGLLAARWLYPEALSPDLFFRFGSQGELSLFTPLYGKLVGWLGLERAGWWLVLSGALGWLAAVMLLAQRMLGPGAAANFAVLLAAVITVSYAPNAATFVLTENFATARSWAFPLGLVSVAMLVVGRLTLWALLPAFASLLLHPLVGIWPLALGFLMFLPMGSAAVLALLPVLAGIILGLVNPDLPYLRPMTGNWLSFAQDDAPDVLFKLGQSRLLYYGAALACLMAASRWGAEQNRPLYRRGLLLGLSGLAMALIAGVWWPVEVIVQGQPWRVAWLLLPLALLALLDVGQYACRVSRQGPLLLVGGGALAVLGAPWFLPALYLLGLSAILPASIWPRLDELAARWRKSLMGLVGVVWLLLLPGLVSSWEMTGSGLLAPWWNGNEWLQGLLTGGSWPVAALLALFSLWRKPELSMASRLPMLALPIFCLTLLLPEWDRRSEPRRVAESCYLNVRCPPHSFQPLIAPGATVYWPGRELSVWFELHRASYHGLVQRTGVVFSRAKFDEWSRRDAHVTASKSPADLCADPILDWLVLPHQVVDVRAGGTPAAVTKSAYLYSCADFR